jgi:hypothetical protein
MNAKRYIKAKIGINLGSQESVTHPKDSVGTSRAPQINLAIESLLFLGSESGNILQYQGIHFLWLFSAGFVKGFTSDRLGHGGA